MTIENPLGVLPPAPPKKSIVDQTKRSASCVQDETIVKTCDLDRFTATPMSIDRISSTESDMVIKDIDRILSRETDSPISIIPRGMRSAPSKMQRDSGDTRGQPNIKVVTRIRPANHFEKIVGGSECIHVEQGDNGYSVKVSQEVSKGLLQCQNDLPNSSYTMKEFPFDSCIAAGEDQATAFQKCGMQNLIEDAFGGINVTVFAYGQTGSGKTYTIHGAQSTEECMPYDGVIPRSLAYIFDKMSSNDQHVGLTFGVSYCEIYNETVYDLLLMANKPLKLKWDSGEGFHAPDIHIQPCNTLEDAHAVLDLGNKRRKQRSHFLNAESSRSHAILTMYLHEEGIPSDTLVCSKINFVDLAGSERLKESGSDDDISIKETSNINKSLFLLGKVIHALASGQPKHLVPYRESKLTKLLFGSMVTPSKCLMIACCSPSQNNVEESLTTLKYATRFSKCHCMPSLHVSHSELLISSLKRENKILKQELRLLRDITAVHSHKL